MKKIRSSCIILTISRPWFVETFVARRGRACCETPPFFGKSSNSMAIKSYSLYVKFSIATVDGCEILHQLIGGKHPIIYRVSTIQGGAGFLPSTVCSMAMFNSRFKQFSLHLWLCLERNIASERLQFLHSQVLSDMGYQWMIMNGFQTWEIHVQYMFNTVFVSLFVCVKLVIQSVASGF